MEKKLKNRKYVSLVFYYCPDKCVSLVLLLAQGCVFVLFSITRPRGITTTITIAIGPSHVYNVIYKAAKNKIVAKKKCFVGFKVLTVS